MPDVQYGWKCPQCSAIYGPTVERCGGCSTPKTIYGHSGTIMMASGTISIGGWSGTVFYSPPQPKPDPDKVVFDWHSKGGDMRELIVAAVDFLASDEDEDDEDD